MTIKNIHGEPVPLIGGITSRNLFRSLFPSRIDRGGTPNALWFVTSVALLFAGIWICFL